ncbi:hypothetical protein SteCoe_30896 [Stentor coeruleus]|uniref:EF-hand domain-containing protein n=1 Tax=Stentor coeruleus TaxID=5963 RepID=A0A1R2B2T5_9CILI|nr:hypothetical protein SteCoe_30896 [Stentor coeruleus]
MSSMSKKPKTPAEFIWFSLRLKSIDSASIEDVVYYVTESGYGEFSEEVTKVLEIYDRQGKGKISQKDLQEIVAKNWDPFNSEDALTSIFNKFDKKGEGYLYAEDIVAAGQEHNIDISLEEARRILEAMDYNQDGAIDVKEFKSVVKA